MASSWEHPVYGTLLRNGDIDRIFGRVRGKGITFTAGQAAQSIFVTVGASCKYPNEVTREVVRYCHSPHADANQAMAQAHATGALVRVRVAPDGGTDTYDWGSGRIVELRERHAASGKNRFVLEHVPEETAGAPEAARVKRPRAADPPPRSDSDDVMLVQVGETSSHDADDVGDGGEGDLGGDGAAPTAVETVVDGVVFHSLLERRHATMLTALGLAWTRAAPTLHGVHLGDGHVVSYTPDFLVTPKDPNTPIVLLEIKPRYPYDDEMAKCAAVCAQLRATIALLYNTTFACPFAARAARRGTQGDYVHADAVRGMLWSWDGTGVRFDAEAAYAECPERGAGVYARVALYDARFHTPTVVAAYAAAAETVVTE
jgi:hypothetical protein